MKYNDICIGQTFNRLYAKAHDRSAIFDHLDIADRKSTRLNSSHGYISYAVFCLKKKKMERRRSLAVRVRALARYPLHSTPTINLGPAADAPHHSHPDPCHTSPTSVILRSDHLGQ